MLALALWAGTVIALLGKVISMNAQIQAALDELAASVAEDTSVDTSAIALLSGLTAKIDELLNSQVDPAEIVARVGELNAGVKQTTANLAASVSANTPAAPPTA